MNPEHCSPAYSIQKAREAVENFNACYTHVVGIFKRIYKVKNDYIVSVFRTDQRRWYEYKRLIHAMHFMSNLPPYRIKWSDNVWRSSISNWVLGGRPKHMLRLSVKEKEFDPEAGQYELDF